MALFRKEGLIGLYIFAFLTNFGWGLIVPLFPLILERGGGGVFSITFSFFLLNFISASLRFPFGYVADVKGRKILLLLCSLVNILSSLLAIFYTLPFLIFAFGLLGISSALYYQTLCSCH